MEWMLLGIGVLLSAELFLRLPIARSLNVLKGTAHKAIRTVSSSRVSDHWKEAVLPHYAFQIFKNSLVSFVLLLLALTPVGIIVLFSEQASVATLQLAVSRGGLIFSTVLCIGYVIVRGRVRK